MFNNGGTVYNNGNGVNVNSRLFTSYSDTAMIVMGAWNSQLSLKVHPFKGINGDGVRQYAQDNTEIINTSITVDNAHTLIDAIDNIFQPSIEANTPSSVSIEMGLDTNKKTVTLESDGNDIYLVVAVGVNENGVATENNIVRHKFNKKKYMVNYNPATGEGEVHESPCEYNNFVAKLRSVDNLSPAIAHSINYNNQLKNSYRNRNNNQQGGGFNSGFNMNSGSNTSAPVTNFSGSDMSAFLPMS